MAGDMNFQFKISANFADLKAAFTQIKTDFNQTVSDLKKAGQDIKIKVKLDIAGLNTDIQNVRRTIAGQLQQSASQSIKVKIEADANAIRADLAAIKPQIQAAVAAMSGLHIKIPVVADLTAVRAQLAAAMPSLSGGLSQPIALKIGIDMQHLRNQLVLALRMVQAAMNVMANMGQSINLNVNLSGAVTGLVTAINELKAEVIRLRQAMGSRGGAGAGGNGGGAGSGTASGILGGIGGIKGLVASAAGFLGVKELIETADSAALLNARLKDLLGTEEEVTSAKERLFAAAQRLQVGYEDVVKSAAKMIPTMHEMGGSTDDAIKLSEILTATAKQSGASTQEAAASAQQFAQALGSGVLQGDELRSILENNSALARALAAALKLPDSDMKVTIGMLRKMGSEGKITSKVMADALLGSYDSIMAKVDQLPATFAGSWTRIKNIVFKVVDELNQSGLFAGAISSINDIGEKIQGLAQDGTLQAWATGVTESVGNAWNGLVGIVGEVFSQITSAWSELTGAVESETGLQITALDILKGVFNGVALAFVAGRLVIADVLILLKQGVREVVYFCREQFVQFGAFFGYWSANVGGHVSWLIAAVKMLAEIVGKVLVLDFSGAKAAWESGTAELEEIVKRRAQALLGIQNEANKKLTQNNASWDKSRQQTGAAIDAAGATAADATVGILLPKQPMPVKKSATTADTGPSNKVEVAAGKANKKAEKDTVQASKLKPKADANEIKKAQLQGDLDNLEAKYTRGAIYRNKYYMEKADLIAQMHDLEIKAIKDKAVLEGKLKEESNKQALAQLQQQYASEKDAAKKADLAKKIESAKKPVVKTDEDVKNESKVLTDIGTAEVAKTNALKALQNERTQSLMDAQKEGLAMRFDLAQAALDAQEKKWESKAAALEEKRKKLKADYAKQRNAEISGDTEVEIKAAEEAAATDVGKQNIEIDLAINTEKAKLSLEKIQEEAKRFTDQQNAQLKNIDLLKDRGQLSNRDAENQKEVVNEATAARLTLYRDELQRLATEGVPQAQQALQALEQQLNEIPIEAETNFDVFFANTNQKMQEAGVTAAQSGLADAFMNIASGAKSGSDAIKDFARGFAQSMARVAADALATLAIFQILKAFGVPVGLSSGGGISIVPKKHDGGIVNGGGQRSAVSASVFPYAPRYHVGGIAGFKPGEVPAVLMKGEEVLTKNDPRHVANGGGQSGAVRIINNIDPNMMHDYMSSSAGEQVIINMIERNAGSIKQLLR